MANNQTLKVGKTILVDPNSFDGKNSSDNISVPLEDLNISVQLRTQRKARTLISSDKEGGTKVINSDAIDVTFIEGATVNGVKALTTNYTDLTTSFDKGDQKETESLGITNIDIDFNSSYAPQIVINFIDIRGSSIFQNEGEIGGANSTSNKYSTFFQLPYPLFELTIKGYYGKPVKYCLHMTKFNAKFNSKTGNFEITANFIGYTYAMLSDMLIGYLKAIPYTDLGKSAYERINSTRNTPVDNLNQLMVKISSVNEAISKISATDINALDIKTYNSKIDILNKINTAINTLGENINPERFFNQVNDSTNSLVVATNSLSGSNNKLFIVSRVKTTSDTVNPGRGVTERTNNNNIDNAREASAISDYETTIEKLIGDYNALGGGAPLELDFYIDIITRTIITRKSDVSPGTTSVYSAGSAAPVTKSITDNDADKFGKLVSAYEAYFVENEINNNHLVSFINVFDLYRQVDQYKKDFAVKITNATKDFAENVKLEIVKAIDFDPTVRNIIEVFTSGVDAFLMALYNVSSLAERNELRNAELKKTFGSNKKTSDINNINNFYPWPDYKKDGADGYVEKYLGDPGVVTDPSLINELVFIDDLYQAFITAAREAENALQDLTAKERNWVPINPFDTRIFNSESPYNRIEGIKKDELYGMILVRAMTFLGYTNEIMDLNDSTTRTTIEQMAQSEAHLILKDINSTTLKSVITANTNDISNIIETTIHNTNIVTLNGANYNYDFIFNGNSSSFYVLPVSMERFTDIWTDNLNYDTTKMIPGLVDYGEEETFLTNYSDAQTTSTTTISKPDDGGKYVKILTKGQYGSGIKELSENVIPTDNTFILEKLQNNRVHDQWNTLILSEAGFNVFGGQYGIQEFDKLDYGNDSLKNLPLRFVFYGNKTTISSSKILNGLGDVRKDPTLYNFINKLTKESIRTQIPKYDTISDMFSGKLPNEKYATVSNSIELFGKNRELFNNQDLKGTTYPYVNISYQTGLAGTLNVRPISLFGSKLYYGQQNTLVNGVDVTNNNQAMLFLSTLPWNSKTFEPNEILNLFANRSGFIHTPRLWCAYVGSLLWRADTSNPITNGNGDVIGGGSGVNDPIQWFSNTNPLLSYAPGFTQNSVSSGKNKLPTRTEYIDVLYPDDTVYHPDTNIKEIHYLLKSIPDQVKTEFKRIFFEFVNGDNSELSSWRGIAGSLEIWPSSSGVSGFISAVNSILSKKVKDNDDKNYLDDSIIYNSGFINLDKYSIITPVLIDDKTDISLTLVGNMMLELNGDYTTIYPNSPISPVRAIIDAMREELVIANATPIIWGDGTNGVNLKTNQREKISVTKDILDLYLNSMLTELKKTPVSEADDEKRIQEAVFGNSDTNVIKFQLYKTCKNIYDKWLGGATDENNLTFQCGGRNKTDKLSAIHSRGANAELALIDSFRFVNRSFTDIGDKFYINPTPVNTFLSSNPNSNFYDAVSNLLGANNFDFIALPSFINFNSEKDVKSMFEPIQFEEALDDGISGPSFVCVYVGQKSKNLDFNGSEYTNDGFDIQIVNDNISGAPVDFLSEKEEHENNVAVFSVNYSQQNQNIFKDIVLDQNEFTETAESLQITDDISKMGSPNNRTFAGQNMYNVYSVRSYKVEVEMMGNAMVQPMMYFQLNNIPMFHGAYMITHVKHNIKPNFMSTHFTGVRIRAAETPLMTGADMYQSLISSLDVSLSSSVASIDEVRGTVIPKGSYPPIIRTIIENNGTNGNISVNNITVSPVIIPGGIKNMISDTDQLLSEAVAPLNAMLEAWVAWMKEKVNGTPRFKGNNGNYAYLNSAFRTYNQQQIIADKYPNSSAKVGSSNHGWGIAIDFQFFRKNGKIIKNYVREKGKKIPNVGEGYDLTINESLVWLLENSYRYGWIIPEKLRDNVGLEEFWHFEYHGKSAACLLKKKPKIKTITVNVDKGPDGTVTNPKDSNGVEAIYLADDCDFIKVDGLDGSLDVLVAANPNITVIAPIPDDIDFYTQVLKGIKAEPTTENLKFFYAWREAESETATWNPFSTTQKVVGNTNYDKNIKGVPVKNYPSKDVGIKATVAALNQSSYNKIVGGLQKNIGAGKISEFVDELETWGTGADISTVLSGDIVKPPQIQITTTV